METIKVTYKSIARRFNITNSTTWAELESKLRSLYNIPTTSSLSVTYTDEDGDVITLSSDLELKEVLTQQSFGKPIKLVLNTDNDSENWVLQDENNVNEHNVENKSPIEKVNSNNLNLKDFTSQTENTEREEESVKSRPPSYYHHVSVTDEEEEEAAEDDQSTPLLDKEKVETEKQQQPEGANDDTKAQTKENDDNGDDDDDDGEIIFIISRPWSRPNLFGPRFGFFGSPRFGLFDGPHFSSRSFSSCPFRGSFYNPYGYGRPQYYCSPSFNGCGGPSTFYSSACQYNPNSCGPKSKACGRNSKQQQSGSCDNNSEASTSASTQNRCGRNNRNCSSKRPSYGRNFNLFNPQTPPTQEQLNDKLSTLHSMGFDSSNDALYKELLKRYNGNIERVIELLLRNQLVNEHYEKAFTSTLKKQNGIVINEEKAQNNYDDEKNVEIKRDNSEENKPYDL